MPNNVNIQPLQDLNISEEQIRIILNSLAPLLQQLIQSEIENKLTAADFSVIEDVARNNPSDQILAVNSMYKSRTGKDLKEISDAKLNELIVIAAKLYVKQEKLADKLKELNKDQLKQLNDSLDKGDYNQIDQMIADLDHSGDSVAAN